MKITTLLTKKTIALYLVLTFLSLISIFLLLAPSAKAAEPAMIDVDTGWNYYYYGDKDIVIATPSGSFKPVAIFKKEKTGRYSQVIDLYGSSPTISCKDGAHIDGPIASLKTASLNEPEKDGCDDDEWHVNPIESSEAVPEVIKNAQNVNFGETPIGCKGFPDKPKPGKDANFVGEKDAK